MLAIMTTKPGRPIEPVLLAEHERTELERRTAAPTSSVRDAQRARIILLRASGESQAEVAGRTGCSEAMVSRWTARFRRQGLDGLRDRPGRGRKARLDPSRLEKVVTEVSRPPPGRVRWSVRSMSAAAGISKSSVQRVWRANDLQPHRTEVFKLSTDPRFEEKFWDVIGLYLAPPDRALVLCCDEKSQCQALERTQRALPLGRGHCRTRTHDYVRHGTVTLFAALSYLEGKVFSRTEARHTHVEWLRFLKQIHRETPGDLTLDLILDNDSTHSTKEVTGWIGRRNREHRRRHGTDRIRLHFTPTSSSWMNLIERFFNDLSRDAILDGSFQSVRELVRRIETYIAEHNLAPRRYVWRADGQEILAKIQRARARLQENELS